MFMLAPSPASLKLTTSAPLASTLEVAEIKWGLAGLIRWSRVSSDGRKDRDMTTSVGGLRVQIWPGTAQAEPHQARAAVHQCAVALISFRGRKWPRCRTRRGWAGGTPG